MRIGLVLMILLLSGSVQAQQLAGIWRGKRTQNPGGCFPEYSTELHIYYGRDNQILGNAFNYYSQEQFTKINFTGRYNRKTGRMVILENSVVQYNVPEQCIPCIKTYDLNWTSDKPAELNGEWKGHLMGNAYPCPPGKIHLEKETQSLFPVEVPQDDSLRAIQQRRGTYHREKEIVGTFAIDSPLVTLLLYDNAEIDGDTVSIFLNNTLLIYKQQLTDKPITLSLFTFPNTDYEFLMYAENQGRIPPNTALMVVSSGLQRREIRLSSSDQKSAVVRFRYSQ